MNEYSPGSCQEWWNDGKVYPNLLQHKSSLLLIPQIFHGLSFICLYPVSLEFTVAQAPIEMRGVMVGTWFASWGFGYFINTAIKYLFGCQYEHTNICTSFYYYLTKCYHLNGSDSVCHTD